MKTEGEKWHIAFSYSSIDIVQNLETFTLSLFYSYWNDIDLEHKYNENSY